MAHEDDRSPVRTPTTLGRTLSLGDLGAAMDAERTIVDMLIGETIDNRYRIIKKIGVGGMAAVYEAVHVDLEKRVAVKVLFPEFAANPEIVERFRREPRAASRIKHPNIVDVIDTGKTPINLPYFVMEYLDGQDLAQLLANEPRLPIDRVLKIAKQIADALSAAHEQGIVHRDLKPENIFLITSQSGQPDFVKIVDFGIAFFSTDVRLTTTRRAMGTPQYMPPEQVCAEPDIDERADIYALAAIIYEMLSGRPPHTGRDILEILAKKNTIPPTLSSLRPEVSSGLNFAVMKGLSFNRNDRPRTIREFEVLLERTSSFDAERTSIRVPAIYRPTSRLSGSVKAALGFAALVAVVVGSILFARKHSAPVPVVKQAEVLKLASTTQPIPEKEVLPTVRPPTPVAKVDAPDAGVPRRTSARKREVSGGTVERGFVELRGGRLESAATLFRQASTSAKALRGLAMIAFQKSDFDEAAKLARQSSRAGDSGARIILANSLFKSGRYAEAVSEYERVLASDSSNPEAVRNLAAAKKRLEAGP